MATRTHHDPLRVGSPELGPRTAILAALVALVVGAPYLAAAAEGPLSGEPEPIVAATGNLERVIDETGCVNVFLQLASGLPALPAVAVMELTRDGARVEPTLLHAEVVPDGASTYLRLSFARPASLEPGSYAVSLRIWLPEGAAVTRPFRPVSLQLALSRRAPPQLFGALALPATLRAERVSFLPGLDPAWLASWAGRWSVRETSGQARVTLPPGQWDVSVQQQQPDAVGRTVRLTLAGAAGAGEVRSIEPGATAELAPSDAQGWFPIGKLVGSFRLQSPQLAAPVVVELEVISRLWRGWLLLLLLLSIVLGHLTRHVLEQRRSLAAARLPAARLRRQLGRLLEQLGDPGYLRRLEALRETLTKAMTGSAEEATAATATVRTGLDELLAERESRREEAKQLLAGIRSAVRRGSQPGGALGTLAQRTLGLLEPIAAALDQGQVEGPLDSAKQLRLTLLDEAGPAFEQWRQRSSRLLEELPRWEGAPPDRLADLARELDSLPTGDLPAVEASFAKVAAFQGTVRALLDARLVPQATSVAEGLDSFGIPGIASQLAAVRRAAAEVGAPREEPGQLTDALVTLSDALVAALQAAVPAGQAEPASIAERRFGAALAALRTLRPRAQPLDERAEIERLPPGALVRPEFAPATQFRLPGMAGARPAVAAWSGHWATPPSGPPPLPPDYYEPEHQQAAETRLKWGQLAISAALITAAGMLVFQEWIGTYQDCVTVLFWGFTVELGTATVLSLAKPLEAKKPFG